MACRGSFFAMTLLLAAPALAQQVPVEKERVQDPVSAEIDRITAPLGGAWGVEARQIGGTGRFSYNARHRFHMASTVKLPLAAYVLHLVDQQRIRLDQMVSIEAGTLMGPGILSSWIKHEGVALSVANLLELTLTASDNDATDHLFALAGGPEAVARWLDQRGFREINVSRTIRETFEPAAGDQPILVDGADIRERATPAAMAAFLEELAQGKLLSAASTEFLLSTMTRSRTGVDRIPAFLPPGVSAAHKSGTLIGAGERVSTNSVGIVTAADGSRIVLAVFSGDVSGESDAAARDAAIAHIARLIYDHFLLAPRAGGRRER